jgi:uncharacterized iron-regulated membrane protein
MSRSEPEERVEGEATVWPVLALLWSASAVRVGAALHAGETFGWEATLALLAVLIGAVAFAVWMWRRRDARPLPPQPRR